MTYRTALLACLLTAGLAAVPAQAGDAPDPGQRSAIEAKLRALGFERWDGIEASDDRREWEVDDARAADGREFDLRLAAADLSEVSRKGESPTTAQRGAIEDKMRALGFTAWRDIEAKRRGREWEIEDARTADGRQFDIRLAADDLRELSRKPD